MYLPENPMVVDENMELSVQDYTPYRADYAFDGWYTDSKLLSSAPLRLRLENDVTLYAKWKISKICEVTFNLNKGKYLGSTENVVISVATNEPVEELKPAPTKEGYTFEGWQLDGEEYKFDRNVGTKPITLTAVWEENKEYTVTFDANGGRPSVESQRVKEGDYAPIPVVTRDGWELRGWYDGGKKYEFSEKVTSDIALKAEWSPKVIFNEGVKVTDENARELSSGDTVRCGSSISVRVHAPQGKRIKSVTIGGTVKPVNAKSFSIDNWGVSRPTTIYAEWEEWKEYAVMVAAGIEHGTVTVPVARAAEGTKVAVTATAETGYKLAGLTYTYTNAAGVRHTETIPSDGEFTMPAAAVEVSAEFKAATATATFVVKDAEGNPVEGASVKIEGVAGEKKTDANGAAKFEGLTVDKEYSYTVSKKDYTPRSAKVTRRPACRRWR